MQPQFNSDLDWQAFAYWSDELSASERARFEARLEDDQQACESLARVVELSYAVKAAESLAVSPSRSQTTRRPQQTVAWSVGVAASALALLLGLAIGQWPTALSPNDHSASLHSQGLNPDLASAWSDIRRSWDDLTIVQQNPTSDRMADTSDLIEHQSGISWDSGELETPSWMAAAVLIQAADVEPTIEEIPDDDFLPGEMSKES